MARSFGQVVGLWMGVKGGCPAHYSGPFSRAPALDKYIVA